MSDQWTQEHHAARASTPKVMHSAATQRKPRTAIREAPTSAFASECAATGLLTRALVLV